MKLSKLQNIPLKGLTDVNSTVSHIWFLILFSSLFDMVACKSGWTDSTGTPGMFPTCRHKDMSSIPGFVIQVLGW